MGIIQPSLPIVIILRTRNPPSGTFGNRLAVWTS